MPRSPWYDELPAISHPRAFLLTLSCLPLTVSTVFFVLNPPFFPQLVNGDMERKEYFQMCERNKWDCGTSANVTQRVKRARGVRGGAQRPPRKR